MTGPPGKPGLPPGTNGLDYYLSMAGPLEVTLGCFPGTSDLDYWSRMAGPLGKSGLFSMYK